MFRLAAGTAAQIVGRGFIRRRRFTPPIAFCLPFVARRVGGEGSFPRNLS